jgi:nitric oxide reductase subunit B
LALAVFSLRNIVRPEAWKERWIMTGFWGLNIGLMGMILLTLVPVGGLQAIQSFENGYHWARSAEFLRQPVVVRLLWLRMIPDTVFIVVGVLPILAAALYGYLNMRRVKVVEAEPADQGRRAAGPAPSLAGAGD